MTPYKKLIIEYTLRNDGASRLSNYTMSIYSHDLFQAGCVCREVLCGEALGWVRSLLEGWRGAEPACRNARCIWRTRSEMSLF